MADKPSPPPPIVTELLPSVEGRMSGLASAHAPFVFFDAAPTMGHFNGIIHIALSALRFMPTEGRAVGDAVMVAHLRTNLEGLKSLKAAIVKVELMLEPVPESQKN